MKKMKNVKKKKKKGRFGKKTFYPQPSCFLSHLRGEEEKLHLGVFVIQWAEQRFGNMTGRQPAAPAIATHRSLPRCLPVLLLLYIWPDNLNWVSKKRLNCLQRAFNTLVALRALGIIFNASSFDWSQRLNEKHGGARYVPGMGVQINT